LGFSRRAFLELSGSLIASALPARPWGIPPRATRSFYPSLSTSDPEWPDLRFSPHYRASPPLESVFRYIEPGSDEFISEKLATEIEIVLSKWSSLLKVSPAKAVEIGAFLAPSFQGCPLRPRQREQIRGEPGLQVWRSRIAAPPALGRAAFLEELRAYLIQFDELLTAEFKLCEITIPDGSSTHLDTRIRYDLVGTGRDFHREQLVGYWDLEWERNGEPRVRNWSSVEETRSRAAAPVFVDITSRVMERCSSFSEQLVPGIDHWRTVLDSASGIVLEGNSGLAVGDIDNDGFDDLYVCQPWGLPNRLYKNRGDGTFEDVTESAGVGVLNGSPCALFADVNNDGLQDLLVVTHTGPLLFMNLGHGKFELRPHAFHFATVPQGTYTGAAFADYDRDGWLDVYFCLYSYYQGLGQYAYPVPYYAAENGPPNFLFRNNRDGTFADVTAASGLNQNNTRYSFACGWCDYNDDGWPDLYVANDFGKKNLYRNNGNGTFTDIAEEAGVLNVGPGMSLTWFDYDNDGKQDLYVANMWEPPGLRLSLQKEFLPGAPEDIRNLFHQHAMGNALFHNEGNGKFRETTVQAGVAVGRWNWTTSAWDFDHDGYSDLYVANGYISGPKTRDLESFSWRQVVAKSPLEARADQRYELGWIATHELIHTDGTWGGYDRNVFFLNNRDGTFSDVSGTLGMDFIEDGRAYALADFDHDGRIEVFLKNRNSPQLRILHNNLRQVGEAVAIRLRGKTCNRDAIGAVISVETAKARQVKILEAGSGTFSQHTKEVFFGLGKDPGPVRVTVRWPGGRPDNVQHFENVPAGSRVEIEEGSEAFRAEPFVLLDLPAPAPAPAAPPLPVVFGTWLIEPQPALDFKLVDTSGREYTLAEFHGCKLLLNFWNIRSTACRKELLSFERHQSNWNSRGLAVAAAHLPLDSSGESNAAGESAEVRNFARENRFGFPLLLASDETASVYNILYLYLFDRRRNLGFPTTFLIDEDGRIVKIYHGPIDAEEVSRDCTMIPRTEDDRQDLGLPFPGMLCGSGFHRSHLSHGVAFIQRGYLAEAEPFFQAALGEDPESGDAHFNLGTLYLEKQMWSEAREHLRRANQLKPGNPAILVNLGVLEERTGNLVEAKSYFLETIRTSPKFGLALQNVGDIYRRQGQLDEAQRFLERALQAEPDNPKVSYSLGMLYAQRGNSQKGREYLLKALRLLPRYPEALNNLGVLYIRDHQVDEGLAAFRDSIRIAPEFEDAYLNMARVHIASGNRQEARAALHELLERQPDHPAALKLNGELADGEVQLDDSSQPSASPFSDPAAAGGYSNTLANNSRELVREYLEERGSVALSDQSEKELYQKASELLSKGRYDSAIEVFQRGTRQFPRSARLATGLGLAQYSSGRYAEAISSLTAASDIAPSDSRACLFLAKASLALNRPSEEVVRRMERFARLYPKDPLAAYYYAMVVWKVGGRQGSQANLAQVESLLKRALLLDSGSPEAHLQLGILFADRQKTPQAIEEFQRAIALEPGMAFAHYRLAQAYKRIGKADQAERELQLYRRLRGGEKASGGKE
jgi:tetratricopeptide (TPR) repeat protein/peroxiredoxin